MRGANAKLHVNKLVTLVAIKLEEKCQSIGHGYRMFDKNGDDLISRDEFKRGLDRLKIKFSEQDTELIFSHLDQDGDGKLNYHEFGSLQKRPIYFPAENPYEQQSESMPSLPSFQRPRSMDFEQLERVAGKMNIIGKTARKNSMKRRGTIPKSYLEPGHIFGMSSQPSLAAVRNGSSQSSASVSSGLRRHNSQMMGIIKHTDNLREGLQKRIDLKTQMDRIKSESRALPINTTKSSVLRSASAVTSKMLVDMHQ